MTEVNKCKSCYQREADTIVQPCGHQVLCAYCSDQMTKTLLKDKCFQCRQSIDTIKYGDQEHQPGYKLKLYVMPAEEDPWAIKQEDEPYLEAVRKQLCVHRQSRNTVKVPIVPNEGRMKRVLNHITKELPIGSEIQVYIVYYSHCDNDADWERWTAQTSLFGAFITATDCKICTIYPYDDPRL